MMALAWCCCDSASEYLGTHGKYRYFKGFHRTTLRPGYIFPHLIGLGR
jgi:hypothetical protein